MRTIRRLYFYTVALVSLEVVLWGLIGLLRTTLAADIAPGSETLAQALALILVGVPIFAAHWGWIQRAAARDAEEQTAALRAIFLYGVLAITLVPAVNNLLALVDRTLIQTAGMESYRAFMGGGQSRMDNLIAMIFNGIAAAYFFTVLRSVWSNLSERGWFTDIRRLYRYLWVLYSLLMVVFGIQQVLRYIFYIPGGALGALNRELFVNGIALLVIGTPIWVYVWGICQGALSDSTEQGSTLRLGVLYLLALAGVFTVLSAGGVTLDVIVRRLLGEPMSLQEFISQIGGAVSIGIPLAGVWAYYGGWLSHEIEAVPDPQRRAGLRRFYYYILSLIGLAATVAGLAYLIVFLVGQITQTAMWTDGARGQISGSLSTLFVGIPLWVVAWRRVQGEALVEGDSGDHARRSVVRKAYLYFVIFASVIGVMASAILLVYRLINAALAGKMEIDFLSSVLNAVFILALFGVVLAYHFSSLRADGARAAGALEAQHRAFPVLVLEHAGGGFAPALIEALNKIAPAIPVSAHSIERGIPADAAPRLVVLPADLALNPSDALRTWIKGFKGEKVVIPAETGGWYWTGGVPRKAEAQGAQIVRQLAEGQEVRQAGSATSPWVIVAYVFGALFGLQVLFILFALAISSLTD